MGYNGYFIVVELRIKVMIPCRAQRQTVYLQVLLDGPRLER